MDNSLEKVVEKLKLGQPVIFPTDTVWGIGVAVEHCPSPKPLFEAKGRADRKPVAWLVGMSEALRVYGKDVPAYAYELAAQHWPGALTLVVEASDAVPAAFRSEAGTIGLRMPDSDAALALIERVGCPLATTSANLSGEAATPSSRAMDAGFADVVGVLVYGADDEELGDDIEDDADGLAPRREGSASTVVDCTGPCPEMLRQGPVVI